MYSLDASLPLEVVVASRPDALAMAQRFGEQYRRGSTGAEHRRLAMALRCPFCHQAVVVLLPAGHSARDAARLLDINGRCLHT